eukprot:TRINITY_DN5503_c0_g1_i1.p1 TRINITY_DN5503_c0_g1~~TRINITY_DN5503_c0_g1_i1.p1  ORF type:complete len:291 (+),score=67.81 TRINITY_DN5503_c0_g1_i1:106-978(+)
MSEKNIDDLMKKHLPRIKQLKFDLEDKLTEKHDNIFLLRYCLSFSNNKDAEKAIRKALKFRKHNPWLQLADTKGEEGIPYKEVIDKYISTKVNLCKIDGGPVVIIRAGAGDPKTLMDELSDDRLANSLTYQKEICMLMCDKLTREKRELIKMIIINDLRGSSLKTIDKRFFSAIARSSKISEKLYPQLVERNVIMNPPSSIKIVISMAKIFMSKRSMEKLVLCKGDSSKGKWEDCPFAKNHLIKESTPFFLGGDLKDGSVIVNNNNDDPIMLEGEFDELVLESYDSDEDK